MSDSETHPRGNSDVHHLFDEPGSDEGSDGSVSHADPGTEPTGGAPPPLPSRVPALVPSDTAVNPLAAAKAFQSSGKAQAKQRDKRTLQMLDALSARDLLQMLFRVNRDRDVKEAVVFLLFFTVFLIMALLLHDVDRSFATTDALQDLLLDEEFEFDEGAPDWLRNMNSPYKKNFFEVFRKEEMVQWTRGPLLAAMHPETYYNGFERQALRQPYILDTQRIVGNVRIRQARVRGDSCDENRLVDQTALHGGIELGRFDTTDQTCFAEYKDENAQTGPWTIPSTGRTYEYIRGMSVLEGLIGYTGGPYGTDGYAIFLSARNATAAANAIADMQDDLWLDRATRVFAADFSLYSAQTRLVTVIRIVFESFATEHVVKYARMLPVPVALYATVSDWIRVVFEIVFLILTLYLTYVEIWKTCRDRSLMRYCRSLSTLVDLVFLVLVYAFIIAYALFLARLRIHDFEETNADDEFQDLWQFA